MAANSATAAAQPMAVEPSLEELGADILRASTDEIASRTRLLENEIKVRSERCFPGSLTATG
jgi:hypothetical protein